MDRDREARNTRILMAAQKRLTGGAAGVGDPVMVKLQQEILTLVGEKE